MTYDEAKNLISKGEGIDIEFKKSRKILLHQLIIPQNFILYCIYKLKI